MPAKICKWIIAIAAVGIISTAKAQITTADNGLTATGTAPNKNVGLGGTLNNAQTAIDFGSSNSSSNLLLKKGTASYFSVDNSGNAKFFKSITLGDVSTNAPNEHIINYQGTQYAGRGVKLIDNYNGYTVRLHAFQNGLYVTKDDGSPAPLISENFSNPSDGSSLRATLGRWEISAGVFTVNQWWSGNAQYEMTIGSASRKGMIIKSAASQTGNLMEWQDNSGAVLSAMNASGNLGIGTSSPTTKLEVSNGTNSIKINPDYAALLVSGAANSSANYPKLNFNFNGDANPSLSILNYNHDNVAISFDAWHNGGSWVSSHSGSNFTLYKANNELVVGYNSGTAAGTGFSSFNLTDGVRFANNGNLGIGGPPAIAKLYVGGNTGIGTNYPDELLSLNAATGVNSVTSFKQNTITKAYVGLGTDGIFRNQTLSGTELQLRADGASNFVSLYTNATEKMRVTATGNVGIGTNAPNTNAKLDVNGNIFSSGKIAIGTTDMINIGSYSLAVNGDAIFNKVKVKVYPWADYVFKDDYPLLPLNELEKFIQTHKHLPGVPAATEVEKEGLDVGSNQTLLLKKIEELTLYMIEQNKKISEQQSEIKKLQKEVEILKNNN
jgi:hypothetical protein